MANLNAGIQIEFDEVDANFTIIPNQVLYNRDLTSEARFLWVYLRSHKVGYLLGYRQMEADLGWSEATVRKHLKTLEAAGYVRSSQTRVGSRNGKLMISLLLGQTVNFEGSTFEGSESKGLNKTKELNKTTKPLAKATPMAPNSSLTESMITWAVEKSPNCDPYLEFEKFKNWHLAKGSTMKNWDAAWRTWILNSLKYSKPSKDEIDPWAGKQRFGFDNE